MAKLGDQHGGTISAMERMNALMNQLAGTTHAVIGTTKDTAAITGEVRDQIADFEDTFRPMRSYFYADPHCYNIPICWGIRSIYGATDGVDKLSEKLDQLSKDASSIDAVLPQLVALLPPQIETMRSLRTMMLTMHSTMSGMFDQAKRTERRRDRHGQGLRRRENRRLLLPASRGFCQPGLPAGRETVPVPGRQGGTLRHLAQGRSRDGRGYVAHRRD